MTSNIQTQLNNINGVATSSNGFNIVNSQIDIISNNFITNYAGGASSPAFTTNPNELTILTDNNFILSSSIINDNNIDVTQPWTLIYKASMTSK